MIAYSFIKVLHIITAILMAWPFYALVIVNQRARLGPPLGDRVDIYMETIIKNRVVPCYIFQATALTSGLGMILLSAQGFNVFLNNLILAAKFTLLLIISVILSYVHFRLQPQIDGLFHELAAAPSQDIAARIGQLRLRRKKAASVCLFNVLTISMLGVQAWKAFPWWGTVLLLVLIAAFTWRAYKQVPSYGWI